MDWADRTAQSSHARRLQVGVIFVKDDAVFKFLKKSRVGATNVK